MTKIKPVYLTKEIADTIIIVDDDWRRRYLSFTEMYNLNNAIFSKAGNFGALMNFGLYIDPDFRGCHIKKEVYNWCIQHGFRYKKVRYEISNEFSVDLMAERAYLETTGILFSTEVNAMAFKLRWL